MNVFEARKVLESKMTDRCKIYRRKTVRNTDNTTAVILPTEPLHTDVHCRISFIRYKVENPADVEVDENPTRMVPKIFFPVFTDIKAGDRVELARISVEGEILLTYSGTLGLPAAYDTHTEVMLNVDTSA